MMRIAEIEDVLFRFAEGQDRKDKPLLASTFSEGAVLDFSHPAARFGISLPPFSGKDVLVDTIWRNIEGLDTSHTVTNQRIARLGPSAARGTSLVEAQHVLRADGARRLLLKNFYDTEYVFSDGLWQASRVVIRTIWHAGDPAVLFPS